MQKIRAFVAIALPEAVQSYLGGLSRQYEQQLPAGAVRWVRPELMHLTLCFLGDIPQAQVATLGTALDEATAAVHAFELRLDRLGCFPNERRPRVIWAGLGGAQAALQRLKQAVDQALAPHGWEPEKRPFQGHVTLGRVKHSHQQVRLPWGATLEARPVPVSAIQLMESKLRPAGPIYTVRHRAVLPPPEQ